MALTIGEASDVNTVLHHALNLGDGMGRVPTSEQAVEAAARLADKANKALGAGLNGDRVRAAWPEDDDVAVCEECGHEKGSPSCVDVHGEGAPYPPEVAARLAAAVAGDEALALHDAIEAERVREAAS